MANICNISGDRQPMTVERAEGLINNIINELEHNCNCVVQEVELKEIDYWQEGDAVCNVHRAVVVKAKRRSLVGTWE